MQDLSHLLGPDPVSALAPTSQAGGNMMSSNRFAMTAPGTQPVDPLPPAKEQSDPVIGSIDCPRSVVTHGDDSGPHGGRPVLRMGGGWANRIEVP
jgi:hypothetical protein